MRLTAQQDLFNNVTPIAITSSADATPIVMTVASHGFSNDDRVFIFGHTTNIAANGIYRVASVTTNTFALVDEFTRANIAGSGGGNGANTGLVCKAPPVFLVSDFKNAILSLITSGTATMTLKIIGSMGQLSTLSENSPRQGMPNIGGTVSASNPWSYLQSINLDTGLSINGSTGIPATGTDLNLQLEVNINAQKYITIVPTAWTQGAINVKLFVTTESGL